MVTAYRLPMDPATFERALAHGQGRARLQIERFGFKGLEREFLDACCWNRCYDPQCEPNRAEWLLGFFEGAPDWIVEPICEHLLGGQGTCRDHRQRTHLALRLAQRGNTAARKALYKSFGFTQKEGCWCLVAAEEIIELDGTKGLLWMAEQLGQYVYQGGEVDQSLLDSYDTKYGKGSLRKLLLGSTSGYKLGLLRHFEQQECESHPPTSLPWSDLIHQSLDELVRQVTEEPEKQHYWCREWKGSWEDREKLLQSILRKEPSQWEGGPLHNLLRAFQETGLPRFDPKILPFAQHPDPDVKWVLHRVLSHHNHPAIRRLARTLLTQGHISNRVIQLLQKSYRPADAALLSRALKAAPTLGAWERHGLLCDILDLTRFHSGSELRPALMMLYEHTPCCNCYLPEFAPDFDWVVDIVNQCRAAGVPYYLKPNPGRDAPGMNLPKMQPRLPKRQTLCETQSPEPQQNPQQPEPVKAERTIMEKILQVMNRNG